MALQRLVQSVNEVVDAGGVAGTEERLSVCERLLVSGGGFAPPTQEVGCGGMSLFSISCCPVLLALFVDFSGGQSKFLGEGASLRNRMVLLWLCFGPSLLVQLLVH